MRWGVLTCVPNLHIIPEKMQRRSNLVGVGGSWRRKVFKNLFPENEHGLAATLSQD